MSKLHWTNESTRAFRIRIVSDFTLQIEKRLEELGLDHKAFAKVLGLSESRVSQILNTPANFCIDSMIEWARALKMKVSVVAYDDSDNENLEGPIHAEVFRECWVSSGKPRTVNELIQATTDHSQPRIILFSIVTMQPKELHIGDLTWQKHPNWYSNTLNLQESWLSMKELQKDTGGCSSSLASVPEMCQVQTVAH